MKKNNFPDDPSFSEESKFNYLRKENTSYGLFGSAKKLIHRDKHQAQYFRDGTGKSISYEKPMFPSQYSGKEINKDHLVGTKVFNEVQDSQSELFSPESGNTYEHDVIPIPLAPVAVTDRVALIIIMIATVAALIGIFILPASYLGSMDITVAVSATIAISLLSLIGAITALISLFRQRRLPTDYSI